MLVLRGVHNDDYTGVGMGEWVWGGVPSTTFTFILLHVLFGVYVFVLFFTFLNDKGTYYIYRAFDGYSIDTRYQRI